MNSFLACSARSCTGSGPIIGYIISDKTIGRTAEAIDNAASRLLGKEKRQGEGKVRVRTNDGRREKGQGKEK
jgi:hypothetical protein